MTDYKRSRPGPAAGRIPGRFMHGALGALVVAASLMLALPAAGQQGIPEVRLQVTAFQVDGDNPLSAGKTSAVLSPYLGEHVGVAGLEAAADALEQAMRGQGYAFHRVIVPPQRPEGGIVVLKVLRFTLGEAKVTGNEHFSSENVLRSLPALRKGETPDAKAVSRALAIANEHPSKRTTVTMREGVAPDTVDAEVKVKDTKPFQAFVSFNNTGSEDTGPTRLTLGAQHGNVFDLDHVITASWTTSPEKHEDVNQYGVNYWAPIYALGASVSAYITYSDVDSGRIAEFFDVSGRGTFMGVRYTHAFLKVGNWSQKLALGFDDRSFRNDVSFSGAPIGVDVRSRPVSARYSGRWDDAWGVASFFVEYLKNTDGGSDNNDAAYAAQPGAPRKNWDAVRMGADATYALPKGYFLVGRFRSQQAWEPLIPGEQMGLGGVNTIRGFEERATAGDRGYQLNMEFWTPDLGNKVRLLAFWDTGYRKFDVPQPGLETSETLGSVGGGVRWNWRDQLDVSADVGYVIDGLRGNSEAGMTRVHFNLLHRF